jgi:hypothetical protein
MGGPDDYADKDSFCTMIRQQRDGEIKDRTVGCGAMWSFAADGPAEQTLTVSATALERSKYWFSLTNCDEQDVEGTQSYAIVNPGGEHLGTGYYPLPGVYATLVIAWLAAFIGLAGNVYANRRCLAIGAGRSSRGGGAAPTAAAADAAAGSPPPHPSSSAAAAAAAAPASNNPGGTPPSSSSAHAAGVGVGVGRSSSSAAAAMENGAAVPPLNLSAAPETATSALAAAAAHLGAARLHATLLPVPVLYIAVAALAFVRWETCSRTGDCTRALAFRLASAVLLALHHTLSLVLLVLLAKGWYVTRTQLNGVEFRTAVTIGGLQFVVTFFNTFYGGYVLLAVLLVYIGSMWYVFNGIGGTLKNLRKQLVVLRQLGIDVPSTPAYAKTGMISFYQRVLIGYLTLSVLNFFVGSFFLVNLPWIRIFVEEALDVALFVMIIYTFRLGGAAGGTAKYGAVWVHPVDRIVGAPALAGPAGAGSVVAVPPAAMAPWTRAMPALPFVGSYPVVGGAGGAGGAGAGGAATAQGAEVIVVQNPATLDAKGKLVPSVGIAAAVQERVEAPRAGLRGVAFFFFFVVLLLLLVRLCFISMRDGELWTSHN